ncbi:ATP-binding cassette domain-containing protein [Dysgonomonas macrotermitis]|uniref:ABC-2 type transport system ATP-binding protein n=1 Tax=Dysgonomonas macrotermitis TaxID=1346286 RepID=A0A1M5CWF8_9BACT|nr:ABC transporter ATP-binding protein [Dysgonomonas macrotermitis]SHF59058.1 ABC-2 type transport system ATP-binding protein [Dysgonomonas macrotermitis]
MIILAIKNLDYYYKEEYVLRNFNFSVKRGEIYGLVGKARSGKTTIINLVLGLLGAPSDTIFISGVDYANRRKDIAYVTGNVVDIPYYQNFLTVWENFKFLDVKFRFGEERIIEVLKTIGLASVRNKKVRILRSEQQKRLSIGLALFHNPEFLVFDDLFRDLKNQPKTQLYKLLIKIQKSGKTILLTNRNLKDIENICSTVGLLDSGNVLIEGTPKRVKDYIKNETGLRFDLEKAPHVNVIRIRGNYACS